MHAKPDDKGKVKRYIENGRKHEEIERRLTVPHRTENPCRHIVKHKRADSAEYGVKIGLRIGKVLIGRIHETQQRRGERNGNGRHYKRQYDTQQIACRNGATYALFVVRTVALRHSYGKTRGQPVDEPEDQKSDRPRESDARKSRGVYRVADNDRIDHTVQLLKHTADKYGHRKKQNKPEGIPLGKIFHKKPVRVNSYSKDIIFFPQKNATNMTLFFHTFSGNF